ncbi:hypothetical protein [Salinispira pacifica]
MQVRASGRRASFPLLTLLFTLAALALNLVLSVINNALNLPFFMDSIGTAVVSAAFGIVPGLIAAVGTELLFELVYGWTFRFLPFAVCGIATVLIIRAFVAAGRFETVGEALLASLAVAMANALLGGVISAFVFGGITGAGIDYLVTGMVAAGQSVLTASFWARVPANLIDKTLAVLVAFFVRYPLESFVARRSGGAPRG